MHWRAAIFAKFQPGFFRTFMEPFSITEGDLYAAVVAPDAITRLDTGEPVPSFLAKNLIDRQPPRTIVVGGLQTGDTLEIAQAYLLRPDFVAAVRTLDPVLLLQALANTFGIPIRVGSQVGPFIYHERVQLRSHPTLESLMPLVGPVAPVEEVEILSVCRLNASLVMDWFCAFALDKNRYQAWLRGADAADLFECELGPTVKGWLAVSSLLSPSLGFVCILTRTAERADPSTGLFRLKSPSFLLQARIVDGHLALVRNTFCAATPLLMPELGGRRTKCSIAWTPANLMVGVELIEASGAGEADVSPGPFTTEITTPSTFAPPDIVEEARRRGIAPQTRYDSPEDFHAIVTESLVGIDEKLALTGGHPQFWDGRGSGRVPKSEPEIQPTIHALLYDVGIAKNMTINPECYTAGARLDFLFTGQLKSSRLVNVCVEFKLAHSDDLVDGFCAQLPWYMARRNSAFGVYCVLYFAGRDFARPGKTIDQIQVELSVAREQRSLPDIHIVVIDVSRPVPPSQLKA